MHVNYSDSNNVNKLIFNEIEPRNRYGYIRIDAKSENWKQDIDKKQKEILKQGVFSKNIVLEVCSINHGYNELPGPARKAVFHNETSLYQILYQILFSLLSSHKGIWHR